MDYEWISPSRFGVLGRPIYKPEFWDKVQELDQWTNKYDPVMTCQPLGLPRQGTPRRIIQTANDIIFFYTTKPITAAETGNSATSPPTAASTNPQKAIEATYYGIHRGDTGRATRWSSTPSHFVDTTWLGRGGLFHSANMHIIEKLTRKGNEILYEMTIEDPDVFVEPWVMPPRTLRLNGAADAGLVPERAYCEVYETGDITTQLRH